MDFALIEKMKLDIDILYYCQQNFISQYLKTLKLAHIFEKWKFFRSFLQNFKTSTPDPTSLPHAKPGASSSEVPGPPDIVNAS